MLKWMLCALVIVNSCKTDSDCPRLHICINSDCEHKDLFPLEISDILGVLCILTISALANASGLGGGPLLTISLLVIINFDLRLAVPLSQTAVCSGTLIGTIMRFRERHPTRDRPAIDYEMLLLIISPILLGTTIGVLFQQLLPP